MNDQQKRSAPLTVGVYPCGTERGIMPKSKTRANKRGPRKAIAKRTTKAAVPTTAEVEPPVPDSSRMGRYFTFTIQDGQNAMFADNGPGPESMELTDEQLTCLWNVNWQDRKITYKTSHIPGARRDYNKGKHGNPKAPDERIGKWTVDKATNVRTYHAAS
jgi:hypothetical protein